MEQRIDGTLIRLALLLEREARLGGTDIEPETQRIIEKLRRHHVASDPDRHPPTSVEL